MLTRDFPRLWSLTSGRWMIVSDLHGDGRLYKRFRNRFLDLHHKGEVDGLILLGDLIHLTPQGAQADASLDMVLDVIKLQQKYGDAVIYLCGNHELPHIYTFNLSKGATEYSPPFEHALTLSGRREEILTFFKQLPFYLRTPAGISITHAGAFNGAQSAEAMNHLFNWDHQAVLDHAAAIMSRYNRQALHYAYARLSGIHSYGHVVQALMGLDDPDDLHYDDPIRGLIAMRGFSYELAYLVGAYLKLKAYYEREETHEMAAAFDLLWDALFTKCEREYGEIYADYLDGLLQNLSQDYTPQNVLVAGHMSMVGGYNIIMDKHFRLASGKHAQPFSIGQYLVIDTAEPVTTAHDLIKGTAIAPE